MSIKRVFCYLIIAVAISFSSRLQSQVLYHTVDDRAPELVITLSDNDCEETELGSKKSTIERLLSCI